MHDDQRNKSLEEFQARRIKYEDVVGAVVRICTEELQAQGRWTKCRPCMAAHTSSPDAKLSPDFNLATLK